MSQVNAFRRGAASKQLPPLKGKSRSCSLQLGQQQREQTRDKAEVEPEKRGGEVGGIIMIIRHNFHAVMINDHLLNAGGHRQHVSYIHFVHDP